MSNYSKRLNRAYYLKCIGILFRLMSMSSLLFLILYLGNKNLNGFIYTLILGLFAEFVVRLCEFIYERI